MFDNLIESGSHKQDIGRKGSFLLATVGIYASSGNGFHRREYLVHGQLARLLRIWTYYSVAPVRSFQENQPEKQPETKPVTPSRCGRQERLIADVSRTELVPKEVSAKASIFRRPPWRNHRIGDTPPMPRCRSLPDLPELAWSVRPPSHIADEPPPPPPQPTPPRAPISGGGVEW